MDEARAGVTARAALVGWVQFKYRREATVCLSPDAYVEALVLERLVKRGVPRRRAEAVARKVRRSYYLKRRERTARVRAPGDGADPL